MFKNNAIERMLGDEPSKMTAIFTKWGTDLMNTSKIISDCVSFLSKSYVAYNQTAKGTLYQAYVSGVAKLS